MVKSTLFSRVMLCLVLFIHCSSPTDSNDSGFIERLELIMAHGSGAKFDLAWSPDGQYIVYTLSQEHDVLWHIKAGYRYESEMVSKFVGSAPIASPSQDQMV